MNERAIKKYVVDLVSDKCGQAVNAREIVVVFPRLTQLRADGGEVVDAEIAEAYIEKFSLTDHEGLLTIRLFVVKEEVVNHQIFFEAY